jgi:phage tail-like protein
MPRLSPQPLTTARFRIEFDPAQATPAPTLALQNLDFTEAQLPEVAVAKTAQGNRRSLGALILRRPASADLTFNQWIRAPQPRDGAIILLGENREPAAVWRFKAAFPVRWAHTPLNSAAPEILMETLELQVSDFERVKLNT